MKLTDFGIAKAASKATITDKGALRGKLLYMSPEQAWGKAMDRRSDVFSLGIVFYEMLTEQKPFLGTLGDEHPGDGARVPGAAAHDPEPTHPREAGAGGR